MIDTIKNKLLMAIAACLLTGFAATSCSDDPDEGNYYTFTGQMMGQYITGNEDYSDFATIVERSGLMDQLNAYGAYTCFLPNNEGIQAYLRSKGKSSLDDLTKEDCDTIAYTHLIKNVYSTNDMKQGVIVSPNFNKRYISVSFDVDSANNPVIVLNKTCTIVRSDSVENGMVHPITGVLESSTTMAGDEMENVEGASLFFQALEATGLKDSLYKYKDENWVRPKVNGLDYYPYDSNGIHYEAGWFPEERLYGFTLFVETDSIFKLYGITDLRSMYDKAVELYSTQTGGDGRFPGYDQQPEWSYDSLTNRNNPLNMFISYHILKCNIQGINMITPLRDIHIARSRMNPEDWYETLLSHTMMNVQKATVYRNLASLNEQDNYFINRRYEGGTQYLYPGVKIDKDNTIEAQNALICFIDGPIAFDRTTSNIIHNRRIRMDMATVFPEMMSNGMRLNGNPEVDESRAGMDLKKTNGSNYCYPPGTQYFEGCEVTAGYLVYRRPRVGYWSYEGDEFNLKGDDYDVTFRLPPVPYSSTYQIRIGYAPTDARGLVQIYFGENAEEPQGIPIDLRVLLGDARLLGSRYKVYDDETESERNENIKFLKNKGYYRGPRGACFSIEGKDQSGSFYNEEHTIRLVACTVWMNAGQEYKIRFKNIATSAQPEMMLDYIELVPKSVYGVTDAGAGEDDL